MTNDHTSPEEADGARQAGSRRTHKYRLVTVATIRLNGHRPNLHRGPFGSPRAHKQGLVEITSIRLKRVWDPVCAEVRNEGHAAREELTSNVVEITSIRLNRVWDPVCTEVRKTWYCHGYGLIFKPNKNHIEKTQNAYIFFPISSKLMDIYF